MASPSKKAWLIAGALFALPAGAHAHDYDGTTKCPTLVSDLGGDAPSDSAPNAVQYVEGVFTDLDAMHVENGEPGVTAKWSDKGMVDNVATVIDWCRQHPDETVYNASAQVYNGLRSLEMSLGAAQ